jgi:hypothetical protein
MRWRQLATTRSYCEETSELVNSFRDSACRLDTLLLASLRKDSITDMPVSLIDVEVMREL